MQIDTLLMFINILNSHFFCSYYIKWLAGMKLIVSLQRALKSIIGFNVNSNVIKFRIEFNFLNVYNLSLSFRISRIQFENKLSLNANPFLSTIVLPREN